MARTRAVPAYMTFGVLLAAGALLLAACGSSASSGKKVPTSGASTSGGSSAYLAQAKAAVATLTQRPTKLDIPPLPSKPASGKTLDFMACGLPVCQAFVTLAQQAAAAVGWTEQTVQIGLTPQSETNGYEQAVHNHPAGVIGSGGVSPSIIGTQLQELKSQNIPVVLMAVGDPGAATAAVASTQFQTENGNAIGQFILADANGKAAHVAIVSTPATPVYAAEHDGLKTALAPCGSCTTVTDSFPETDIGTTLPSQVVSFLRTHADVNYLFFDFSNEVDGVPAALQSAGLASRVKITTSDTTATENGYLKNGQEAASAAVPWPEAIWNAFNIILSVTEGTSPSAAINVALPHMIFTGDNLITSPTAAPPALVANYQSIFKTAWHVG